MDTNTKIRDEWIKNQLQPGVYVCLVDLFPNEKRFICKVLNLINPQHKPVWLRLRLLGPETYPEHPGEIVDYVENRRCETRLHCSFRNLQTMMKHIFLLQPILHLSIKKKQVKINGLLDIAEAVSSLMILECCILRPCSKGNKCPNRTVTHLIRYKHE